MGEANDNSEEANDDVEDLHGAANARSERPNAATTKSEFRSGSSEQDSKELGLG